MRYLFIFIASAIIGIAHYISDARREKRGLPSRHRRFMSSSYSNSKELDGLFLQQMEAEAGKIAQAEILNKQRENYVFEDQDADMDSIKAEGVISPKEDEDGDMMDSI